ncbi:MAG TPA: YicC/YloC family endoribonuclease [Gemmatimonadaceae bacterium]|nr:YicC/YloC family endoribonuclease [Gemmatimonadaceae bacterium]
MIRSMTGFGAAEGRVGTARVAVEVRSVNHRFFTPTIKLPSAFARWEGEVREALRQRVTRGHVTLFARVERDAATRGAIDEARFAQHVAQLRELQSKYALGGELDLATVLRMPEVFAAPDREDDTGAAPELLAIVESATAALGKMREQEGARLAEVLRERLAVIESALSRIAARAPERLVEQRDRLRAAVEELAGGVAVDGQRLAQEIAIIADRLDVSEELDRFRSHIAAFRGALDAPPADGVGKRLGFLLQEMLREANTTGSKAADAAMLRDVVAIKEELERIREQVENLE